MRYKNRIKDITTLKTSVKLKFSDIVDINSIIFTGFQINDNIGCLIRIRDRMKFKVWLQSLCLNKYVSIIKETMQESSLNIFCIYNIFNSDLCYFPIHNISEVNINNLFRSYYSDIIKPSDKTCVDKSNNNQIIKPQKKLV